MTDQQFIVNLGGLARYAALVPRIADDELGPFDYRLYSHYVQICGASDKGSCWENVRTTAEKTRMSVGQVVKSRDQLAKDDLWIVVDDHPTFKTKVIQIVDRWAENMSRYAPCSPGEPKKFVVVDSSISELKELDQQQLTFISVHDVNIGARLQYLIDRCKLLQDVSLEILHSWVLQYGADRVSDCARWYCWQRDLKVARTGAWLRSALEQGWTMPNGFRDDMYLSPEDNVQRYVSGKYADDIES